MDGHGLGAGLSEPREVMDAVTKAIIETIGGAGFTVQLATPG